LKTQLNDLIGCCILLLLVRLLPLPDRLAGPKSNQIWRRSNPITKF
jgi:hypothetical protein